MKKTLLSITAVLAALTVFFVACQSPVTNPDSLTTTVVTTIPEISGPEWVRPIAYPGVITVSWAFVKDAKSYTVYRQRTDGKDGLSVLRINTAQLLTPSPTQQLLVLDTVSPTNQLADGAEYAYYVTANNNYADSGRETFTPITTSTITDTAQLLRDGATRGTVTARVPARYVRDDAGKDVWQDVSVLLEGDQKIDANKDGKDNEDEDWIKAEKVTTTAVSGTPSAEKLLLSWPHYNPGFQYTISYDIGKTLTLNTFITSPNPSPDSALGTYAFYGVPLFGGENTARIVVRLGKDDYYYKPLTIAKELPSYSKDILTTPAFSASPGPVSSRTATTAQIIWKTVAGAPNYTDYKLYRIESPDVTDGSTSAAITVTGDWVSVPIGGSTSQSGDIITVQDTGLTPSKGYLYALYAEVGTAKSAPVFYGLAPIPVSDAPILDLQLNSVTALNGKMTFTVVLGWNKEAGHDSYLLEKAPITTSPTDPSKKVTGNFVTVTASPSADGSGRYTVTDTPELWKGWIYRLTAKADGVSKYKENSFNIHPFLDTVESSIDVVASSDTAYANRITIGRPTYNFGVFVDIYRAVVPENIYTSVSDGAVTDEAVENAAFTKIKENLYLYDENTYTDKNLLIGTKYIYRHVVKVSPDGTAANATVFTNLDNTVEDQTGFVREVIAPSVTNVVNAGSHTEDTVTTRYFEVTTSYKGAKIELQKRATTASPSDPWSLVITETLRVASDTPPDGSINLIEGDYYIQFTEPETADKTDNAYRLVLVDQDGTVANRTVTDAGNVTYGTTVGTW